ncbi:hypothetical protein DTO207G8_8233 [Paecilomyces variotii]|nr:hypothetical protein DTO207G8_8233 [Paecilomyces variotii]KAJ9253872.1 hypothetical protein DTO195F2_6849 [Paecilomyces variotii]KAJ9374089.1 hypothetical protein DTO282E5_1445 [Paecilomyces variotii]
MDEDVVAQFTEITGSSPKLASQYLELADFNLEQAIQLFFENGGAEIGEQPSAEPQRPSRRAGYEDESGVVHIDSDDDVQEIRSSSVRPGASGAAGSVFEDDAAMARRLQEELYSGSGADSSDGVRAPMARTTERLVGPETDVYDDNDMHSAILSQLRTRQSRSNRPGIFNQRDTSSIWVGGSSDASHRASLAAATGGASEASSKSNMLAEMYRPPFELMSRLPWDLAREEGRENEKWILVNIQDPSIFDCQVLNRDLWKDPAIMETVKEHFIFLQYSKDDPRAAPYLQYYFHGHDVSDNYPHIAIVDPRTGEQVKVWSGPPVVKAADFLMQLHEFLDRYSLKQNVRNPVAKRKPEKEKTIDAMTEEEMMEMALRNSLGSGEPARKVEDPDELTKGEGDVEGKGKGRAVEEDEDMEEAEEEAAASPFYSIPSDRPHVEPPADPATTTRIQFRHPSGRVIRRFALSDPVQRIYEWLKADPPLKEKAGVEFELNAMGQNLIEQLDTTIADAGLKNGTVMIQYIED